MRSKILQIIFSILILASSGVKAQITTGSPYTRFGIGEVENQNLGRSSALGGLAIGLSLPYEINTVNPASYTAIPAQMFLFGAGVRGRQVDYLTTDESSSSSEFGLTSLNAAFRANKFWAMSFGVNPLSSTGYDVYKEDSVFSDEYDALINTHYIGQGGLNEIYLGNAFSYKGFSLGANLSYIWGPLIRKTESILRDSSYYGILNDYKYTNIGDFHARFGAQYTDSLFGKFKFTAGAYYEGKTDLKARLTRYTTSTIVVNTNSILDTLYNDTISSGTYGLPQTLGLGLSIYSNKILFGFDYTFSNWENVTNMGETPEYYTNSSTFAAGIDYTPNFISKKFFERLSYRAGFRLNNSYLTINGNNIVDKRLTLGIGFPTKSGSKINVAFEYGTKGTTDAGLIKENYYGISLNISMIDRWFIERKFE